FRFPAMAARSGRLVVLSLAAHAHGHRSPRWSALRGTRTQRENTPRSGRERRSGVCFRHLRRAHLEYAGTQGFSHVSRSSQATRRSVSHRARPPRAKTWCLAMTLLALYLLALLDGILCGLRTAMGRNALIRKRWYYLRATLRGLLGAQLASMV